MDTDARLRCVRSSIGLWHPTGLYFPEDVGTLVGVLVGRNRVFGEQLEESGTATRARLAIRGQGT
jgi:hypothetical protein